MRFRVRDLRRAHGGTKVQLSPGLGIPQKWPAPAVATMRTMAVIGGPLSIIFRRTMTRVAFVVLAALSATAGARAEGYQRFEPRPVGDVLPARMIAGPHHPLAPTVQALGLPDYVVM